MRKDPAPFPLHRTFHDLFEEQVDKSPDAIAVVHGARSLSYRGLDERANQTARSLVAEGVKRGDFVGILKARGVDFLTSILAIFKAGAAYVPLDPTYPKGRLAAMLDDSGIAVLISDAEALATHGDSLPGKNVKRVLLLEERPGRVDAAALKAVKLVETSTIVEQPRERLRAATTGIDPAYMIYTSGSTGRPKGAICRHDGALNHLFGELFGLGIEGPFGFLQTAASSSDISVWQFLGPILTGGQTVVVDHEEVVDPSLLLAKMRDPRVTLVELIPVVLRSFLDHVSDLPPLARALPHLRVMMATGDALPIDVVNRFLSLYPEIPVANTYGPTEASDDITLFVTREPLDAGRAVVPIGSPLPNLTIRILDSEGSPVASGEPGEITVSGIGVGNGYHKRPDKTAEVFVPCPYSATPGARMYRTGDLGRELADGSIEFLGRIDHQVKIRGFRIEPGEIEAVLLDHPGVQDAIVLAPADPHGNRRLVAYVVLKGGASCSAGDLRGYLSGLLSEAMVPSGFVFLAAMPLSPVGKVDRKALIERGAALPSEPASPREAPRGPIEEALAAAWMAALRVEAVGALDHFYELGGDSVLVLAAAAEAEKRGIEVSPKQILQHPTVRALARVAKVSAGPESASFSISEPFSCSRLEGAMRAGLFTRCPDAEDAIALSATQAELYLLYILSPKRSRCYVEQLVLRIAGPLDEERLARAFAHAARVHPMLRAEIQRRGLPRPTLVVRTSVEHAPSWRDFRGVPGDEREAAVARFLDEDRERGVDLGAAPLSRVTAIRLADDLTEIVWTYHHIILDGWSEPIVLRTVLLAYEALGRGQPLPLATSRPFRDYADWLAKAPMGPSERAFRSMLAGFVEPVALPAPAREAIDEEEPFTHGYAHVSLSEAQTRGLVTLAQKARVTLSSALSALWLAVLAAATGRDELVVGTTVSGRQAPLPGLSEMVGSFISVLPLRVAVPQQATLLSLARAVHDNHLALREHEHCHVTWIEGLSAVPQDKRPLFDHILDIANFPGGALEASMPAGLALRGVRSRTMPHYATTLFVVPGRQIDVTLIFRHAAVERTMAAALLERFVALADRALTEPGEPIL